jgi:hypothetical protein
MLIVRLGAVYIVSERCQLIEDERHLPKRRCNLGHKEQLPLSIASPLVIFTQMLQAGEGALQRQPAAAVFVVQYVAQSVRSHNNSTS